MKKSFVVIALFSLLAIIASNLLISSSEQTEKKIKMRPAEHYPRWLKNDGYRTSQTSGITFLNDRNGEKEFLLADDIGKIHRLVIKDDTLFNFSEIKFSDKVNEILSEFPKLDFEEIFYDKFNGNIYLSVEGNREEHLKYHGIYRLRFINDDISRDTITAFEKIKFTPETDFYNKLQSNIGYEGFTADENYFYLGLENNQTLEGDFSNNTVIRIADKNSLTFVKEISTDSLNISTICGLYSDKNYSLWGIDRNQRKVFILLLDEYFNIINLDFFDIKTVIPGYVNYEYVGSLESITLVSEKFLFLVDDPWHTFFIPPNEILNQLDTSTINNFKNFIPVIHKYVIE